mmetsp:Transcript_12015/g.34322  ORF Transcript_12015/g.34322 Transcript_12015/m.34322 type:complete len:130 (+) Transcript_12015:76-465(+)
MPAAGHWHTVLLCSDGRAVACGDNTYGQCDIPAAEPGVSYRLSQPLQARYAMALQLSIEMDSLPVAICRSLAGSPLATWKVRPDDCKSYVMRRILQELTGCSLRFSVVLPDGKVLTPSLTFGELMDGSV